MHFLLIFTSLPCPQLVVHYVSRTYIKHTSFGIFSTPQRICKCALVTGGQEHPRLWPCGHFFNRSFRHRSPRSAPHRQFAGRFSVLRLAPKLVFYKDGAPQWLFRRGRGRGGAWDHHHGHAGRHRWDIFSFSGVGRSASGAEVLWVESKFSIIIMNGCPCQLVSIQFRATRFITAQCTSNQSNPIFSNQSSSIFNPMQSAEVVQSTSIQLRFSFLCPKLKSSFVAEQRAFPSHEK